MLSVSALRCFGMLCQQGSAFEQYLPGAFSEYTNLSMQVLQAAELEPAPEGLGEFLAARAAGEVDFE